LGTSFGRGGATTYPGDLQNSDCIVIMGSNMAEAHPVGFQWVMEAKERGAKIIHADPRFTRTSAVADLFVPLRAGSDIAFLGGIVNYILEHERDFREYVCHYTNAGAIIDDDFRDTEDLDGLFSGWDPERGAYDNTTWHYKGMRTGASAGNRAYAGEGDALGAHGAVEGRPPHWDVTLQDPRCVYQIVKRHFSRYTPEVVEDVCGVPRELFLEVAEAMCANSGRERTSVFCYAVGWTQHTTGVQYIRTAAIIQLLLGNIGRPGGGIMALRGHASIQGSTDVPTLYDILPGYIPMPHAVEGLSLESFVAANSSPTGGWANMKTYLVSLLKAWWGDAATADNDFAFDYLPRISGDHSTYQSTLGMLDGSVHGFLLLGENPAVGSAHSKLHRLALAKLDWLVVRDLYEIESASFWYDSPEIESGELRTDEIGTEVFLLPAAAHTEKAGTFTNTQRVLQWRDAAAEPIGDARSDLWFAYRLGETIRHKLGDSTLARDRPVLDLQWSYPTAGAARDPVTQAVLQEINGRGAGGLLSSFTELRDDGTTSCGCWIYCGCEAVELRQRRWRDDSGRPVSEWGWAWPANRRVLYNRASAAPDGTSWSARKQYVWWDDEAECWHGADEPDFDRVKRPGYRPAAGARGADAIAGDQPFIMQGDGVGWLYAPAGLADGPLPTHYEPHESPVANPLYAQQTNPAREVYRRRDNPDNPPGEYPFVATTYRLTEHHTAGGMSRTLARLAELQPAMFCEVSPELARLRGLEHGGWATISTTRASIEARVLVTARVKPLQVGGHTVHQVGLPYHWGSRGLTKGDAANDLFPLALDPNVHIQEVKAATCDIRPGRRARGPRDA
jgi:formate dehydrogenase major subunit